VIAQLATVRVRPARIAAKVSPHTEVEPFDMRSAHKAGIGVSRFAAWDRAHYPARGIEPIGASNVRARVELYQLGEVDMHVKVRVYRVNVCLVVLQSSHADRGLPGRCPRMLRLLNRKGRR
jgi:hypothetical protein